MKNFNLKSLALCGAVFGLAASAGAAEFNPGSHAARVFSENKTGREYKGEKPFDVNKFEARIQEMQTKKVGRLANSDGRDKPAITFDYIPTYDYMEGPNGEVWFYTVEYLYEDIYFNEFYTEPLKVGFTATIYDSQFNLIGTVRDKIRYSEEDAKGWLGPDGEPHGRDVEGKLDPSVSQHFFNNDDKYEVMFFHAMNSLSYNNHYYYDIYQINGEKDEDGNDVPIGQMEGRCVEAVDHPNADGTENFIYTFVHDPITSDIRPTLGENRQGYIEELNKKTYHLTTYQKAGENEWPTAIFEHDVYATALPGQMDGIYYISKQKDGEMYFAYIQYEKPLFIDPLGGAEDETMTPDNALKIDIFKLQGEEVVPSSSTRIPIQYFTSEDALIYTFLSCGDVTWSNDIDMDIYGTPEAPAFIITTVVAKAADLDAATSSIDIYDSEGKKVRSIAEGSSGMTLYTHVTNDNQPIALFLVYDEDGMPWFIFKNLYDGKEILRINQQNDGDPLYYSCNIVKDEDGDLQYVFEMYTYDQDNQGNSYARIAWFNSEGVLSRIDRVNMGRNVQYAMTNLYPESLNPYVYDDDDAMEYAVLLKRTYGETTRNEFIVVDDDGLNFINFSADDGRGDPTLFTLLPGETNRIMMVYASMGNTYNVDLYDLPFLTKEGLVGVEEIVADGAASNMKYDGDTVWAEGATIEVYSVSGILEAGGKDSVSVKSLTGGIYVVVATDAKGNKSMVKIAK